MVTRVPRSVSQPVAAAALLGALAACGGTDPVAPRVLTVEEIAGEYELVRVGTRPVPTNANGRVTIFSGHLSLGRDLRYVRTVRAETCVPTRACTTGTAVDRETWLILRDGSLYLDGEQGYAWPPQPIEADGREVRFYLAGDRILDEVYERR